MFSFAAEITGNRHNFSNQPPQLAVVTAPPKESLPKNVAASSDDPANTRYTVSSVTKKSSRSDDNKGQFYAHMSETTIGTKKTSYSEKVASLQFKLMYYLEVLTADLVLQKKESAMLLALWLMRFLFANSRNWAFTAKS